MRPKISVIIVNYNGEKLIADCLRSLEMQTLQNFELIIVDNHSLDSSLKKINAFISNSPLVQKVSILSTDRNLGFTGGNIKGLNHALGEYIALLNNDTEVAANWLEELSKAMDSHLEVGICASKMVASGTNSIDSAGDGFSSFFRGFKLGEGESISEFNLQKYVFGACAGAALYRRKALEETGFLDDDFFLVYEDTDLNFRVQLAGWKVLYIPTAVVLHKVRSTLGHMSDTAVYYSIRNCEYVRIKNVPFVVFLRYLLDYLLGTIAEFIYFVIKHKKGKIYLQAKKDVLKSLPKLIIKRKEIMAKKKVTNRYLIDLISPGLRRDFLKAKITKIING
jgi:GT2 family glycosyltransferase